MPSHLLYLHSGVVLCDVLYSVW